MWKLLINSEIKEEEIKKILSGENPALIIENFFDKEKCLSLTKKIGKITTSKFNEELRHIGPFLMEYTTRKEEYFSKTSEAQKIFEEIFEKNNPIKSIHKAISQSLPDWLVSIAKEKGRNHSPSVIRIHEKGKSIPIHKDNIKYEGKEYGLSFIDSQLSCVLHIQESESGGDVLIYNKKWDKEHEKFREIEFGYTSDLVKNSEACKISNLNTEIL